MSFRVWVDSVLTVEEGEWILSSLFEHASFEDGSSGGHLVLMLWAQVGAEKKLISPKFRIFGERNVFGK